MNEALFVVLLSSTFPNTMIHTFAIIVQVKELIAMRDAFRSGGTISTKMLLNGPPQHSEARNPIPFIISINVKFSQWLHA